jgi:hypothetical protein
MFLQGEGSVGAKRWKLSKSLKIFLIISNKNATVHHYFGI